MNSIKSRSPSLKARFPACVSLSWALSPVLMETASVNAHSSQHSHARVTPARSQHHPMPTLAHPRGIKCSFSMVPRRHTRNGCALVEIQGNWATGQISPTLHDQAWVESRSTPLVNWATGQTSPTLPSQAWVESRPTPPLLIDINPCPSTR